MSDLIFLAQRMPLPPEKGMTVRSWQLLQRLAAHHRVHLGCFYDDARDAQHLPKLNEICASVLAIPLSPSLIRIKSAAALLRGTPVTSAFNGNARLARWIDETLATHHPTQAFVSGAAMAPYLENHRLHTRAIDMVELTSEKWRQRAERSRWPLSDIYWRRNARCWRAKCAPRRGSITLSLPRLPR
jgi:hypothetical protein